jgi:hypothetical protein
MQGLVEVWRSGRSTMADTPDQQQYHRKRLCRAEARSLQENKSSVVLNVGGFTLNFRIKVQD